ncbi:MAG TPA: Na/Pi symporter, partial [Deinococcales bacterium]|nr:Na/Pi symporter [Deinococcales bacterium]
MLVIGGLGLFLFGLSYLASNVESLAGATLNRLLRAAGRSPVSALLSGILVATLVQSGAAISLMTGSFMDAGLLGFAEALSLALGSMLGATVTVQLASAGILGVGVPLIGIGFFVTL